MDGSRRLGSSFSMLRKLYDLAGNGKSKMIAYKPGIPSTQHAVDKKKMKCRWLYRCSPDPTIQYPIELYLNKTSESKTQKNWPDEIDSIRRRLYSSSETSWTTHNIHHRSKRAAAVDNWSSCNWWIPRSRMHIGPNQARQTELPVAAATDVSQPLDSRVRM